jgi:hypothetical protein
MTRKTKPQRGGRGLVVGDCNNYWLHSITDPYFRQGIYIVKQHDRDKERYFRLFEDHYGDCYLYPLLEVRI